MVHFNCGLKFIYYVQQMHTALQYHTKILTIKLHFSSSNSNNKFANNNNNYK